MQIFFAHVTRVIIIQLLTLQELLWIAVEITSSAGKKIAQQSSTAMTSSGFSKHFQLRISLHSNTASFLDLIITLGDNEAHELSLKIYFSTLLFIESKFCREYVIKNDF